LDDAAPERAFEDRACMATLIGQRLSPGLMAQR
jgi:hypothetical protein